MCVVWGSISIWGSLSQSRDRREGQDAACGIFSMYCFQTLPAPRAYFAHVLSEFCFRTIHSPLGVLRHYYFLNFEDSARPPLNRLRLSKIPIPLLLEVRINAQRTFGPYRFGPILFVKHQPSGPARFCDRSANISPFYVGSCDIKLLLIPTDRKSTITSHRIPQR